MTVATAMLLAWAGLHAAAALLGTAAWQEPREVAPRRYGVLAAPGALTCLAAAQAVRAPEPSLWDAAVLAGVAIFGTGLWRFRGVEEPYPIVGAAALLLGATLALDAMSRGSVWAVAHATGVVVLVGGVLVGRRVGSTRGRLRETTAELGAAASALRRVQEELVDNEQRAAVGRLSAVIAQGVREPLELMDRSVESLRRGGLEARERTALLRVLDDETDRLNRLVRDLLTYARPMTPQAQPMELSAALRSAFDRARRRASATRGAPPPFAIVGGPEAVRGDPDLLGLAFERALETALEALAEGETLVVELARESLDGAGAVRVRVPGAGARPEGPETAHDVGFGHALIARAGSAHGGRLRETAGGLELTLPAE